MASHRLPRLRRGPGQSHEAHAFFKVALRRGIGVPSGLAKQYLIFALEYYNASEAIRKRYPDYRIR